MDTKQLQRKNQEIFSAAFGRTSLRHRIDDIVGEAIELKRFVDVKHLKEELGDLLASAIQCAEELDINFEDLVVATHEKIERRKAQYKALGRKVNVAILGGAFDPPHPGHIRTAQLVLNASKMIDEVWLMPCAGHMHGKEMAPYEHRLRMCQILAERDGRIKVSDYEASNGLRGETYTLLNRITEDEEYKDQFSFHFIIGLDNANSIDTWVNSEALLDRFSFIVTSREGEKQTDNRWYLQQPHLYLENDGSMLELSSTQIKRVIKDFNDPADEDHLEIRQDDVDEMLGDDRITELIFENHLYGT